MCGICGGVNFDPKKRIKKELIVRMLDILRHRGPDEQGLYCDGNVVLGHDRLSIIDLEGGHQPVFNEDKSVCAVVNGEIYNYLELRKDLESSHVFSTRSDSEVIVHLWEEYGERCVERLRGMFAFAIYDMTRKKVFLARDRFGQKPVVYADTPHGFYFSSEIYPLTQIPCVDASLCHGALDDFLSLHYIPAPNTIYNGIKKLQPAHTLTISADGMTTNRYWSINPLKRTADSFKIAERKVHGLLAASVRYRMIADVSVAAFLSGGVDSSILVAMMRELEPASDIQTVCMGFDERPYDERPFARQVSEKLGTIHHEHVVPPDVLGILPDLVRHYGEPYGDASAIPTWYLSQVTANHVKVALSGDGGDEIFAGYNRFDSTGLIEIYQKLPAVVRKRIIEPASRALPDIRWGEGYISQLKRFMEGASQHPAQRFVYRNSVFSPDIKDKFYTRKFRDVLAGYSPADRFFAAHESMNDLSETEKLQHIDLGFFLPDDILTKIDIASMAHSLEVRSPFLDHELAEYVLSLPFEYKHKIFKRKRILKKVGRRFFSADFLHRRKKGFRLPIGGWFRTSLRKPLIHCLTRAPVLVDSDFFETGYIRRLLDEHQSGKMNHADRLWNLWVLGEWSKLMNVNDKV